MCYRSELIKKPQYISFDQFKKIVNEIRPLTISIIGSGEPLLHSEIDKMIAYGKKIGARVNLCTNGTLLKNKAEELIFSGLDLLNISIDSARPETYIKIRRSDRFRDIMKGIELLNQIKREKKTKKPCMRFQFCIQQDNVEDIKNMVNLSEKFGVDGVFFQVLETFGRTDRQDELDKYLDVQKLKEILEVTNELAGEVGIDTNIPLILKHFSEHYNKDLNKKKYPPCFYPWYTIYIDLDGRIQPCCDFAGRNTNKYFGNVFEDSFMNVYNNPKLMNFRRKIRKGCREEYICKRCVPLTLWEMIGSGNKFPSKFLRRQQK
jgi:radical SAM protein with 4Fe4S-binding SPASM domain